ncbi:pilus assembly protein PilP [Methylophaga sp. OBS1]|uniref:pilus assembly protein PilP n=1 Tax=Methylophaga sp. OBS1 TaxID=2991933 RepID=UPI00224D54A3|nr:pilus assembly protein PilP [Methylophaga sp. OBS1]MCX4192637.1 pilus assembly protein PilP [Methylophaga sp. OBS1]
MLQRFKTLAILLFLLPLVGCQQDKEDLNSYVARVKAQQKSDIPPIPVMKTYESFDYAAADLRDPFIPTVVDVPEEPVREIEDNGLRPDENRRKEVLEQYALSEMQFVGTLEQDQIWALIRSPDGVIHRVQVGNYMGLNYGEITAISDTSLELREIVPNGNGGFVERETTVAAVEVK